MKSHIGPSGERGAVLLEAFIAILLFSMGILALAGVQATAVKHAADAKYRSEAAYLANQIIAQMWADAPGNLSTYKHNTTTKGSCDFSGGASANANVASWLGSGSTPGTVRGNLPGAADSMQQITVEDNNAVTVTVCWLRPGDKVAHSYVGVAHIND